MSAETMMTYQQWRAGVDAAVIESYMTASEERSLNEWMEVTWRAALDAAAQYLRAKARLMEEAAGSPEGERLYIAEAYRHKETALLNVAAEIEAAGEEANDGR